MHLQRIAFLSPRSTGSEETDDATLKAINDFVTQSLELSAQEKDLTSALDLVLFLGFLTSKEHGQSSKTFLRRLDMSSWIPSLFAIINLPGAPIRISLVAIRALGNVLAVCNDLGDVAVDKTVDDLFDLIHSYVFGQNALERRRRSSAFVDLMKSRNGGKTVLEFTSDRSNFVKLENATTVTHTQGGRGYCLTKQPLDCPDGSRLAWTFTIHKESVGNEGTCVGISLEDPKDVNHRTTKEMWLYRAYSGQLYHDGEQQGNMPEFSQGDRITAYLSLADRTLSFAKNGGQPRVAFTDLPVGSNLHACVMFYSLNPGEQVQIGDVKVLPPGDCFEGPSTLDGASDLKTCEPELCPEAETVSEAVIEVLRKLYQLPSDPTGWSRSIERHAWEVVSEEQRLQEMFGEFQQCAENLKTKVDDANKSLEALLRRVFPLLSFVVGLDEGLCVGCEVSQEQKSITGIVLGAPAALSKVVKVKCTATGAKCIADPKKLVLSERKSVEFNFPILGTTKLLDLVRRFAMMDTKMIFRNLDLGSLVTSIEVESADAEIPETVTPDAVQPTSSATGTKRKKKPVDPGYSRTLQQRLRARSESPNTEPAPFSVELVSDQLVSSIIGEVTGKRSELFKKKQEEMGAVSRQVPEDRGRSEPRAVRENSSSSERTLSESEVSSLTAEALEEVLVKALSLQHVSLKALAKFVEMSEIQSLLSEDNENPDLASTFKALVSEDALSTVKGCMAQKTVEPVVTDEELDRSICLLRAQPSRRNVALKSRSDQSQQRSTVKRQRREAATLTGEQLAIATAAAMRAGPIHEPLRDMGFTDAHISTTLSTLGIRRDDTSAESVNRCAAWMIDHPQPNDAMSRFVRTTRRPMTFTTSVPCRACCSS